MELVSRICTVENSANSAGSVSWHAYREAEGLTDTTMAPELVEFLGSNPSKDQRKAAYFIIGKLGKNLQDPNCASSLLSFIPTEKDKYALAGLLDSLADIQKPIHLDLRPIYQLLTDKRWLVRYSAIQALNNTASHEAEDQLLSVLTVSVDPNDLIYCHATLNRIGTEKSLPQLQEGMKSRKRDVKLSAQAAIDAIQKRSAAQQGAPGDVGANAPSLR